MENGKDRGTTIVSPGTGRSTHTLSRLLVRLARKGYRGTAQSVYRRKAMRIGDAQTSMMDLASLL